MPRTLPDELTKTEYNPTKVYGGFSDPVWKGQLVRILRGFSGYPISDKRTPILAIVKEMATRSKFLPQGNVAYGSYMPSDVLDNIPKLFLAAKMLNRKILRDTACGSPVLDLLVMGLKQKDSKKVALFHLALFNIFMFPSHLIFLLSPEFCWMKAGPGKEKESYTYGPLKGKGDEEITPFDGKYGKETFTSGRALLKGIFSAYTAYKKLLDNSGDTDEAGYLAYLSSGPAEKLVNQLAVMAFQMVVLTRVNLGAAEARSRKANRVKL